MIWHDDEGMNLKAALDTVAGERFKEKSGVGIHLKETAAIGGNSGNKIRAKLLRRRERHRGSIEEDPGLKPFFLEPSFRGLKAPAPSGTTSSATLSRQTGSLLQASE